MKCYNCGAEFNETMEFCPNCGIPVLRDQSEFMVQPPQQNPPQQYPPQQYPPQPYPNPAPASTNKNKTIIIAAIAVVILVVAAIISLVVINGAKPKVDIDNYIATELSYSGTEGAASVSSVKTDIINYEELYSKLAGNSKDAVPYSKAEMIFELAFDVVIPERDDLKNGDSVEITINVDYDEINDKDNGFANKLKGDNPYVRKYVVNDLSNKVIINPFDVIKSVKYNENNDKTSISYDKTYDNKNGDYTVKYSDSNDAKLSIKNKDGVTVATVNFKANYDGGNKATVKASVNEKASDSGYEINTESKSYKVKITKRTTTKKPTTTARSYEFIRNMNNINYVDYEDMKSECTSKRRQKYPDAEFVCSYFVMNENYIKQNAYREHAVNGINYVFYSPSADVYMTCSAFNIVNDGGHTRRISTDKYPSYYVGNSTYPDPYDSYTSKIRYSGNEKNWTSIEMFEENSDYEYYY